MYNPTTFIAMQDAYQRELQAESNSGCLVSLATVAAVVSVLALIGVVS